VQYGDHEGCCHDRKNIDDWVQCPQCKVWYREKCDEGTMKCGLCTLRDKGFASRDDSDV
jgi:primosomal protein N'